MGVFCKPIRAPDIDGSASLIICHLKTRPTEGDWEIFLHTGKQIVIQSKVELGAATSAPVEWQFAASVWSQ
jgi:hypothetical protein